ncbi:hypothetical protein V1514DRAFT_333772 [Lipomyces japonicus]|uniref:uncharacterized protein n=1 Tax=Lipomyces japonicus TaxID=56871 RepID=UPI0034CD873C
MMATLGASEVWSLDASQPARTWPDEVLNRAVVDGQVNKIIALDCMYHFYPSRFEFLRFSASALDAASSANVGFVAEDLILGPHVAWWHRCLLYVVCKFAHTPYGNFITRSQYVQLLSEAGFGVENGWQLVMHDITNDVFPGLARFLDPANEKDADKDKDKDNDETHGARQVRPWLRFERFKLFGKIVRWWADYDVVRSVVIVLKKQGNNDGLV